MWIACIGGAHIDRHGVLAGPLVPGTSNPGRLSTDFGGVASNVAENLLRLGQRVSLVSRVGGDEAGRRVIGHLAGLGADTSLVTTSRSLPTASYTAILESTGELVLGLADMQIYDEMTPPVLEPALPRLREHELWFVDTNLPEATIGWLLDEAGGVTVAIDAVSVVKSRKLRSLLPRIGLLFCNVAQTASITDNADLSNPAEAAGALRQRGVREGVVTAGAGGIAVWMGMEVRSFPAVAAVPRDVTGAGDALIAGTLFGLSRGLPLPEAAQLGLAAAAITVESGGTTAADLTADRLYQRHART